MLLHRVGDGNVKAPVGKGQVRRVSLPEFDTRHMLLSETNKLPVPIQASDLRQRIPVAQRLGQRAGAAADLQNAQGPLRQIEQRQIAVPEAVVKPQLSGGIERHAALDLLRPYSVHKRASILFFPIYSDTNKDLYILSHVSQLAKYH